MNPVDPIATDTVSAMAIRPSRREQVELARVDSGGASRLMLDEVTELYRHYLELKPNDPDVMTDLGIAYRETQEFDKSLEQFQLAQKAAPGHWQAYYNEIVVLAFDLKKFDQATQILAKLQQMQPGNPDVAKLAAEVARQRNAA